MATENPGPIIAGRLPAHAILERLARDRPVFHSEADFQHAFARALWEADDRVQTRLEARQAGTREYLDLLAVGLNCRTAIEFKYWTRQWSGSTGEPAEQYNLRSHAATDIARRNFIFDIERLERFAVGPETNGLAVILTNDPSLWSSPRRGVATRDGEFRIHEGRTLAGTLIWGGGDFPANTRELVGRYELTWRDYSRLDGPNGAFRYMVVETRPLNT